MSENALNGTKAPPAKKPLTTAIAVKWARENLFNSWLNSFLTVAALWLIWTVVSGLFSWGWLNAAFGTTPDVCQGIDGACWAAIGDMWRLFVTGTYPQEERWRAFIAIPLIAGFSALFLLEQSKRWRWLPVAWFISLFAFFYLVQGGRLALAMTLIVASLTVPFLVPSFRRMPWMTRGIALLVLVVVVPTVGSRLDGLEPVSTHLWGGLMLTLLLSVAGILVSFPFGVLLALGRRSTKMPVIRALCVGYIELIRGVPLITILFMSSVMIPLFFPAGFELDKLLRAQIGIILFAAAYLAEVVRGGLQALPKGQAEAAAALGLSYFKTMVLIILPQALRIVIPPLVGSFIALMKDTSLVSIIGLFDLLAIASLVANNPNWIGKNVEAYVVIGAIYWVICYSMAYYSRKLEKRFQTGFY